MCPFVLIGVARHSHDRDVRMVTTGLECECDTVRHRHLHVSQKQIEFSVGLIKRREGASAIGGFGEIVSIAAKRTHQEFTYDVVIFGD